MEDNVKHSDEIQTLEQAALNRAKDRADDGGVWARSRREQSYLIFCVGQEEWQIKAFLRFALENGLGFKPLRGCYKGEKERSFITNAADLEWIMPFIQEQESILLLHDYDRADIPRATLVHLQTGQREYLGRFMQGTHEVCKHYDSWTFDPLSGCYFVTRQ